MKRQVVLPVAFAGILMGLAGLSAADQPQQPVQSPPTDAKTDSPPAQTPPAESKPVTVAPAVQPKPLSDNVDRGLKWLVEHQLKDGAWGQGEESQQMGGGAKLKDVPSVADTCMAALALFRAGSTPAQGPHAKNLLDAVKFVCGEIEESDKDTLDVTRNHGTRVQTKLGTYIDTFAASLLLAEMKGHMPDEAAEKRLAAALAKLLAKIQKNQRPDGTWEGNGWATTLQQNFAVKGVNRAAQKGVVVDETVRERAEEQSRKSYSGETKKFSPSGSAGVELYSAGANLSNVTQSVTTNARQEADVKREAETAAQPAVRAAATAKLGRFKAVAKDQADMEKTVIARLDDKQFLAGFGSNGGEEFLSYLNIGESLVVKGGDNWKTWDKSISQNLNRVQNADGSWSGHHCITGRTFCTSAALLVLMVDRSPSTIAAKMQRR